MLINCLVLFLLFFTGCTFPEPFKKLTAEELFEKERDKRIYSALRKFRHAMQAKGYFAAGIGEGIDHSTGKQNYMGVTFEIESLPDVEFARKIEVEALQEFLCYINSEEGIQEYVAEYPYPVNFINVAFVSRKRDAGLCLVSNNSRAEIYYLKDECGKPLQGPLIEVHRESYQDAVRILEGQ